MIVLTQRLTCCCRHTSLGLLFPSWTTTQIPSLCWIKLLGYCRWERCLVYAVVHCSSVDGGSDIGDSDNDSDISDDSDSDIYDNDSDISDDDDSDSDGNDSNIDDIDSDTDDDDSNID